MNQKIRIALFVFAATVFNVVTTVICFAALALPYAAFIVPRISGTAAAVGFFPLVAAAFALAFFVYRVVLKRFLRKYPLPGQGQPQVP